MPGLVGLISKLPSENCRRTICSMLGSMTYESFYSKGSYFNEGLGAYAGWVCQKGAFSDCMPVWNESEEICFVFAGENFAGGSEIGQLRAKRHQFNALDASYLVHLYEEEGIKFVERLNGWFSGIIVDLRSEIIALFNDRYGMHRVFFYEGKDAVYFASEAKALLAVLPELREIDPKGMGEFLTCNCTLGEHSLFRGLNVLPGGSLLTFEDAKVKSRGTYFDLAEWLAQEQLGEDEFSRRAENIICGVVQKYAGGSLPVGISLTGGLDSRMVMACLDLRSTDFPCYTFGSMYRDTFDVQIAREVAKACSQAHHVLILGEKFLRDFPEYLEKAVYLSDGYIGMSGAAELYMNRMARALAPVRLTGNYGDEVLRGHRTLKYAAPRGGFINPGLQPYIVKARHTFQEFEATDPVTFGVFRQAARQSYGRLTIERSQVTLRTPFMDNELVRLAYQAAPHVLRSEQIALAIIASHRPYLATIPTDRGWLYDDECLTNLIRRIKQKFFTKGEYWSNHGMPSWLAAVSPNPVRNLLENTFLGRNKFQHFGPWSQKRFFNYITDVVLQAEKDMKQFFNQKRIETMVREHINGRRNYLSEIDQLLTIILAHRSLLKHR